MVSFPFSGYAPSVFHAARSRLRLSPYSRSHAPDSPDQGPLHLLEQSPLPSSRLRQKLSANFNPPSSRTVHLQSELRSHPFPRIPAPSWLRGLRAAPNPTSQTLLQYSVSREELPPNLPLQTEMVVLEDSRDNQVNLHPRRRLLLISSEEERPNRHLAAEEEAGDSIGGPWACARQTSS